MCNIDPCTDDKVNLITLHDESYNFVSRTLSKFYTVVVGFKYLVYLLKRENSLSNQIYAFKKALRWQFGILEYKLINNFSV